MTKKILYGVLSIILCAVVVFVSCYFAIPDFNAWVNGKIAGTELGGDTTDDKNNDDTSSENYEDSCDLNFSDGESDGIQLMSAKIPYEAYAVNGIDTSKVAYQLTATISPATAENKAVDWFVKWVDSSITSNVNEYITVTPTYDGSLTANVVCEKAFTGEIAVVVTTRQGGCTAEKICVFVGKPTSINVSSSKATINNGATALSVGVTYDFDISQSNVYNSIGADYKEFSVGMVSTGTLTMGSYDSAMLIDGSHWSSLHQASLSEIADNIISYSLNGSVLSITIKKNIDGYYESRTGGGRNGYQLKNAVQSVDSECYFTFGINNKKIGTNLQYQLKVTIDTTSVSGVSFSDGVLEF